MGYLRIRRIFPSGEISSPLVRQCYPSQLEGENVTICRASSRRGHRKIPVRRHHQTRGGGLAVIHRDTITVQPRKHKLTHSSFELQIVNIGLKSRDIVLANIYRPPSSSKPLFFEEFGLLLTNLGTDAVDRLLICGDFNLPGTSPDKIDSGLAELLESTSFTQFVNSPTRHDSHHLTSSLLDLIITPSPFKPSLSHLCC